MNTLSIVERRALKARAHHLNPVVIIGDAGLTPSVLREVDVHLKSHELIKIRVLGDDRDARATMIGAICEALNASPVQQIGKILVVFRRKPPAEPAQKEKPARATRTTRTTRTAVPKRKQAGPRKQSATAAARNFGSFRGRSPRPSMHQRSRPAKNK